MIHQMTFKPELQSHQATALQGRVLLCVLTSASLPHHAPAYNSRTVTSCSPSRALCEEAQLCGHCKAEVLVAMDHY
jgi:hypothetical protein